MRHASAWEFPSTPWPESRMSTFLPLRRTRAAFSTAAGSIGAGAGTGSGCATAPPSFQQVSDGKISVAPDIAGRGAGAHPGRDSARQAIGVGSQRRIERAMVGGLVPDEVDDAAVRT